MTNFSNELIDLFQNIYNESPQFITTSSGRVVLIGDHIDYNNFGVLTYSIDREIKVAIGYSNYSKNFVTLQNNNELFSTCTFVDRNDMIIQDNQIWCNYVIASFIALIEYIVSNFNTSQIGKIYNKIKDSNEWGHLISKVFYKPINILIYGNIPMGSGISSSSALVVSSFMAFSLLAEINLNCLFIAEICTLAEKYVGTQGGGMDQSTICFSNNFSAQYITFNPIKNKEIELPKYFTIVLCHLLIEEHKVLNASVNFNKRVFECKIGTLILIKALFPLLQLSTENYDNYHFQYIQELSGLNFEEILQKIKIFIKNEPYTKKDIELLIEPSMIKKCLSKVGECVWKVNNKFQIQRRAIHVYTEARRVLQFIDVCNNSIKNNTYEFEAIGEIINKSYLSQLNDLNCSCPQAEELRLYANKCDIIGSRLVGAGWGGYMAFFLKNDNVEIFKEHMTQYYLKKNIELSKINNYCILDAKPFKGMSCYRNDNGKLSPIFIDKQ